MFNPPEVSKSTAPLRFGILGAADIGPQALILPAKSHPGVVIQTVAARNPQKAKAYAQKHGILKVVDTYEGKQTSRFPSGYLRDQLLTVARRHP